MPNYPGTVGSQVSPTVPPPVAIYPGDSQTVFSAEQPVIPQASDRVHLALGPWENYPPSVSIEGFFSGAPGAFEIDIQDADTDADAFYQTVPSAGVISAVSTNNTFRAELVPIKGKFVRAYLKTRTNGVNLTLRFFR